MLISNFRNYRKKGLIYDIYIKQLMEESGLVKKTLIHNSIKASKKGYFKNSLKSLSKRFSSLVISNTITIQDNQTYFKLFMLYLEKSMSQRTQEDELAISKILSEENIFPEFQNDINVLRIFAKNLTKKFLGAGEQLFTSKTKDENLYKILKGQVNIKNTKEGTYQTKVKGEFIQKIDEYKLIKDIEVECKTPTYLLMINFKTYEQAMMQYLQNKVVLKMMARTALFHLLKRKELAYLMQSAKERILVSKQYLYHEQQQSNKLFYFLVEGQVIISKLDESKKQQILCYLSDGSLFGEDIVFNENSRRQYSASIHSSQARIIIIGCAQIADMISHFQLSRDQLFPNKIYCDLLERKKNHYSQKLLENNAVSQIYQSCIRPKKLSDSKHIKMNIILKNIENYAMQLESREKILEKRNSYVPGKKLITLDTPLFGRNDFPQYRHTMKRYEKYEREAKGNSLKLPQI